MNCFYVSMYSSKEREEKHMKKKQVLRKQIMCLAKMITKNEVNSTCPLIAYQPVLPACTKKLKKN